MTQGSDRERIEAYYRALCTQDYDVIESFLDDDVQWSFCGPVDVLPFCGTYRGKAQVRHVLEHKIAETLGRRKIVSEYFLVDGGHCALLGRLTGMLSGGQTISYRIAQFFTMRNGKVVEHRSLLDSFDAVEQVIGRRIELSPGLQPQDQPEDAARDWIYAV